MTLHPSRSSFFGIIIGASPALLLLTIPTIAQTTVYYDNFNRTGSLSGSTPTTTTGGAPWIAVANDSNYSALNGTAFRFNAVNANTVYYELPFTPTSGCTYSLSVDISSQSSMFIAFGFTRNDLKWSASSPFIALFNTGVVQANTSSTNIVYNSNALLAPYSGTAVTLRINYTTAADGTAMVSYFVNNTQLTTGTTGVLANGVYTYSSAPTIDAVYFADYDPNAGTVDNFTLTAVPEPSTNAALAGLTALGFAVWRRRKAGRSSTG